MLLQYPDCVSGLGREVKKQRKKEIQGTQKEKPARRSADLASASDASLFLSLILLARQRDTQQKQRAVSRMARHSRMAAERREERHSL